MSWELEAISELPLRVDVANLEFPDARTSPQAFASHRLWLGNERVELGDLFRIRKNADHILRWSGELRQVDGIGSYMRSGKVEVHGDAGNRLGDRMSAGELCVHGNAGDDLGRSMQGGRLLVFGHCGARAGSPMPGSARGMNGGTIIIQGNCGAQSAERMRRGLLAVGGSTPSDLGHELIAGTIVVREFNSNLVQYSKRGSILCVRAKSSPQSTFRDWTCTESDFPKMIYQSQFKSLGLNEFEFLANSTWQRAVSDNVGICELFCREFETGQ